MTQEARPRATPVPTAPARWRRRVLALAAVSLVFGCAAVLGLALAIERTPIDPAYAGPQPLPTGVRERFAYPEAGTPPLESATWEKREGNGYSSRWLKVPVTTPGYAQHVVQVIHFRSHAPGRRPAVVISPILGGKYGIAQGVAIFLAQNGIHGAVVLRAESYLDGAAPPANLELVLRTAVIDRRRTVDWLAARDDVDPQRIGAFGASMGGITTALFTSVEPRVRAAVLMMAGGDLAEVILTSQEPRVRRFVSEQGERGLAPEALAGEIRAAIAPGPLALAGCADARQLLLIGTRRDVDVPFPTQERLWEALGRPERILLPTGHRTVVLYLPYLLREVRAFFERALSSR